jgi:cytosine/adenosine deaminase-related metal-dependent hydrolase
MDAVGVSLTNRGWVMKTARALLLGLGVTLALGAQASETTRYSIFLTNGVRGGEQVVTRNDDGLVKVHMTYKDNGRGPDFDEQFRLAPDGTFTEFQIKGASTYGALVDEHFSVAGGRARWTSTSEKGDMAAVPGAMYVPLNSTFEAASVTLAALAARKDGKLPLLPNGTLSQRKLDEIEVSKDGKTQRVQLFAQTGLGLEPVLLWATTGPKPHLFAIVEPGLSFLMVEDGWEANGKALEASQVKAESVLLKDLAAKLQQPVSGLTVIRNARVFDSETAKLGAPSDVYVLRGKITEVLPAGSPVQGADNEIDAKGRVMLPGLFDMHAHVTRWEGGLNLAAGVTTVRDMGNSNARIAAMIDETAAGELLHPQIVAAGFIEGESPLAARSDFVVSTLQQAKDAIDWYAERGYPQLKVYNSFHKDILRDTVAYAHSRGMRVSGHVPAGLRAQDVIDDGFDEIQHVNQLLLNFLVTPTTDTRTLDRFILPAEGVADLDFDSKPVQDFIALMVKKQIVSDPTVTTFDFIRHRDGEMSQAFGSIADHLPPDRQRALRMAEMKVPDDKAARYEKSFNKMVEFVGRMYRAGVPIVAGTDELAGFTLQRELEFYVQAGITPAQALQIATRNGAKYTRTSNERGSIAPGKLADLILVDGDPTTNISDIRKVALVMTRGKVISPSAVYQALGIKPFVSDEPRLMTAAKP